MSPAWRNDPEVVARLLRTPATWAVVGLRDNPARDAWRVARFLRERLGHRVVPVHPYPQPVEGEPGYPSLAAIPDGLRIDVVDCFVNSSRVGAVIDAAVAERSRLGISAVWTQLGVIDLAATERARDAGLDVVVDACPVLEWPRLAAGPK